MRLAPFALGITFIAARVVFLVASRAPHYRRFALNVQRVSYAI